MQPITHEDARRRTMNVLLLAVVFPFVFLRR